MEDPRLTYAGLHRGRKASDRDWLDYHHGDRYLPRHAERRYVPRCLPRELSLALLITTT